MCGGLFEILQTEEQEKKFLNVIQFLKEIRIKVIYCCSVQSEINVL